MANESVTIGPGQKATGTIPAFPDPLGFVAEDGVTPAQLGSVPVWESLDTSKCTVTVDPDGMTNIQIMPVALPDDAPPATTQVKMSFDQDRGAGVVTIEILFDVIIMAQSGPNAAKLGGNLFSVGPQ